MIILISIWSSALVYIIYLITTAKQYPREFEKEEEEKFLKEFEEYKKRDS